MSRAFIALRKATLRDPTKLQEWRVDLFGNMARVTWGQFEGKTQTITRTVRRGKQGRTIEEQLQFEMASLARKKVMRAGYDVVHTDYVVKHVRNAGGKNACEKTENKEEEEEGVLDKPFLPMLATTVDPTESFDKDVFVQPKLDGLRCLADLQTGRLWSRSRKLYTSLDHISKQVRNAGESEVGLELRAQGCRFLDGELFSEQHDFQMITSIARRMKSNAHIDVAKLKLYVFDAMWGMDLSFARRWDALNKLIVPSQDKPEKQALILCPTIRKAGADVKLQQELDEHIARGFEGVMFRIADEGVYRFGARSAELMKCKAFLQEEFSVQKLVKHRELDTLGAVELTGPNGIVFNASPAVSAESKHDIWLNRDAYETGQWRATVKFHQYSRDGIPRFPVLVGFRHLEDMGKEADDDTAK